MSSLSGAISIALRSLQAQQAALEVTSNNISNVNTAGYSRQQVIFNETAPLSYGSFQFGTGVTLASIASIRDRVLELRLHQETQQQGKLDSYVGSMQQVEVMFNEAGGTGLQGALSGFFNSVQELSTDPSNLPLRQKVLAAAQNLTSLFRQSATSLASLQGNLDRAVSQSAGEINRLTTQIADLNRQVSGLEGSGQETGSLVDQRDQLIRQLSGLVDLNVIDAGSGSITLTTANGTSLVVGGQALALGTQVDPLTGFQHITAQGTDITATLQAGRIAGLLQARDQTIPSVLSDLDNLASSLANSFNAVHKAGIDMSGVQGGNFFAPPPAAGTGAAANFIVAITDPTQLAASLDGSPGDNANLLSLSALQNQAIVGGQKPVDFYANLVARIGNEVAMTNAQQGASNLAIQQLENQRGAISGVSLDEEAANLLKFQRAFQAAAHVVSVIDEVTQTMLNLGKA